MNKQAAETTKKRKVYLEAELESAEIEETRNILWDMERRAAREFAQAGKNMCLSDLSLEVIDSRIDLCVERYNTFFEALDLINARYKKRSSLTLDKLLGTPYFPNGDFEINSLEEYRAGFEACFNQFCQQLNAVAGSAPCAPNETIRVQAKRPDELVLLTSNLNNSLFGGKIQSLPAERLNDIFNDITAEPEFVAEHSELTKIVAKNATTNSPALYDYAAISTTSFSKLSNYGVHICTELSPEDELIHTALVTEFLAGNTCISFQQLEKTITHNKNARLTAARESEIMQSLMRMRNCNIVMTNYLSADKLKRSKIQRLTMLINADIVAESTETAEQGVYINGQAVSKWIKIKELPLLGWSQNGNNIARIDMKKLNPAGKEVKVNNTKATAVLRLYLLKQIAAMPNISPIITLVNLFDRAQLLKQKDGSEYQGQTLRSRIPRLKQYTLQILDSFKADGLISDYQKEYDGRELVKVHICK